MAKTIKNKNGSAFLYVLLVLMLLSSIILAFLSDTLHYIKYASNYKYKNKSYYIAKSGVELATFLAFIFPKLPCDNFTGVSIYV